MKIIIDGSYSLHRAFHIFPYMQHNGNRTGNIYGVIRDVFLLAEKWNTTDIHIAWDSRSFRKDLSDDYKANRVVKEGPSPYDNVDVLYRMLSAIGIMQYKHPGMEGDDIVYTLAQGPGKKIVYSKDKDLLQCLTEDNRVIRDLKEEPYTLDSFKEEFGFPFSRDSFVFYKCVVGDGSDNIKGIHRFPKKELKSKLNGGEMKPSAVEKLFEGREIIEKNKTLFELQDIKDLKMIEPNKDLELLSMLMGQTGITKPFLSKGAELFGVGVS